jgi:hypothetical protein
MLARYLLARWREPLARLRIFCIHDFVHLRMHLQHALLHRAHLFVHVLWVFHRILQK